MPRPDGSSSRGVTSRRRGPPRVILLLAIMAAHLLIIFWLISRPIERAPLNEASTLILFDAGPSSRPSSPPRAQVKARPLSKPTPILLPPVPIPDALPEDAIDGRVASSSSTQPDGGCHLSDETAAAIQQNSAAMAELASLPPGIRTEADAVMLWNGRWLDEILTPSLSSLTSLPAIGEVRQAAESVILAAPPSCRDLAEVGPAFVPIAEPGRTTMLVIGSGTWRWADLVENEPVAPGPGLPIFAP